MGSQVVLRLIDRFPIIVWLGGGLLGWIAGSMFVTDSAVLSVLPTAESLHYPAAVLGALAVVALGWIFIKRSKKSV